MSLSRSRLSLHSGEGMYFTFAILLRFLFLFPSMTLTPRIGPYWGLSQRSRMFTKFSELWLGSTPVSLRGLWDLWNLRPAFRHHTAVLLLGLPETHETTCKLMDWPRSQGHVYANIWNSISVTIFYKILHLFPGRGKVQPWPKSDFPLPNIEATEHEQYLIKSRIHEELNCSRWPWTIVLWHHVHSDGNGTELLREGAMESWALCTSKPNP